MPLQPCRECLEQVSSEAAFCPYCGAPVAPQSPTITETAGNTGESATKAITFVFGALYVLGLLITNAQLMALGIADFSALQARFVLIGALFVFYSMGLVLTILTPVGGAWMAWKAFRKSSITKKVCWALVTAVLLTFMIATIFAGLLGYAYPWGRPFELRIIRKGYTENLGITWHQFREAYVHAKVLFGIFNVALAGGYVWIFRHLNIRSKLHEGFQNQPLLVGVRFVGLLASLFGGGLVISGYADDVFPNLRYNYGGGQPRIVEFRLADTLFVQRDLPELAALGTCKPEGTRPLALWHQDAGFFYVTPIPPMLRSVSTLSGVSVGLVRAVHFREGALRISSGGRIDSAMVKPDSAHSCLPRLGPMAYMTAGQWFFR